MNIDPIDSISLEDPDGYVDMYQCMMGLSKKRKDTVERYREWWQKEP